MADDERPPLIPQIVKDIASELKDEGVECFKGIVEGILSRIVK